MVVEGFDVDALFPPVEPPRPFDPPPATFAHLRGAVAPLVRKWLDPATSNLRPLQQRGIKKILLYLDNVLKGVGEHDPGDPNGGADGMTLFVSKLPPDLSDDQFAELFASVNIQNVELAYAQVQRAVDGTSRGYGLVKFYIPSEESEDEENAARRGSGTKSTPEKKREAAEKRAIRKRAEDAVAAIGQREPIKVGDRTLDIKLASANQVERFEQGRISCTYRAFTAAGKTMVQGALAFMLPLVPQRSRPAYASSCPGRVWIWCPSVASWKNAYKSLFVDFPKVVEVLGLPPEWLLFALGTGPRDKRILDNDTLSSIMRTEDRFAAIRRCQILIATPNLMRNLLLDHEKCRTYLTEEEYDPRKKTLALFHAILVDEGDYGTKRTGIFTRMLVRHVDAIKIYFSGTVDRPAGDPLVNVTEHTKYGELLHYGVVKPMVITLLASAGTASDGRLTNYSKLRKKCLDAHSTPDELRVFVHEIVERWLHNRTEDNLPGQMLIFVPAAASGSKATAEEDARSKVLGKQILDMILGIVREKTDGKTCPILGRPLKAEMLSSSKDAKARADIEAQFGLLDIDILVVLDMYSRSADFPLINHVAHLRAYLDENGYPMIVQRGGRGVRGIQRQLYDHIRQHQLAKGLQMPEFDDVKRQVLHVFEIAHHLHLAHYQRMMVEEEVLPGQFVINPIWRVAPPPETKFTVFLTQAQANPDGTARIMAETEVPIKMELSFGMKMRWSEFVEDIADNFHGSSNNLFVYTVADDGQLWQMIDGPPDMLALDWITEQRCRRDNLGRWCLFSTIAQPAVEESGDDDQALRGRQRKSMLAGFIDLLDADTGGSFRKVLRQEEERNRRNLSPNPDTDMIELPDPTLQQQQQETSQSMQDSAGNGRESGAGNGQSNDGSDNGVQPPVIRQPNGRSTVIQQDDTSGGSTDTRTQVPEPRPQSEHPPDPQIGPPSGSGADKIPKDGHRKSEEINGKQLKKTEGSGSVAGASNGKVSRTRDSTPLPPPRQDIYITGRIAIGTISYFPCFAWRTSLVSHLRHFPSQQCFVWTDLWASHYFLPT